MGETQRQMLHLGFGLAAIILLWNQWINVWHLVGLLLIGIVLSILSRNNKVPVIHQLLKIFGRPDEKPPGKGALALLIGVILALLLGKGTEISYAAIAILAVGDSAATVFGCRLQGSCHVRKTKSPFHQTKLLEGTLFGIICAGLAASIFVSITEAFIAAAAAMAVEGIEFRLRAHPIDDNILIPLIAVAVIYLIRLPLGGV